MLAGLGFNPFFAAGICLLANTAPVAFGSIGIPVITLAGITGLPLADLSANVGRICAPVSLFVPAYLVMVMTGFKGLRGVFPAAAVCGIAFAGAQFLVSNYLGPQLTDILGALASMGALVMLLRVWRPKDDPSTAHGTKHAHSTGQVLRAWIPYALLVLLVLIIGIVPIKMFLDTWALSIPWPGLHNEIMRVAPAVKAPGPYPPSSTLTFSPRPARRQWLPAFWPHWPSACRLHSSANRCLLLHASLHCPWLLSRRYWRWHFS